VIGGNSNTTKVFLMIPLHCNVGKRERKSTAQRSAGFSERSRKLTDSCPMTHLARHEETFREANDATRASLEKLSNFFLLLNLNKKSSHFK
jgi:hypothetical protein